MKDKLTKLYGIGPALAAKIESEGVNGVRINPKKPIRAQLKKASIFPHLPIATQIDLTYNPTRSIPRKIIDTLNKSLSRAGKYKFDIAGSYRRGKQTSRDVDIIIERDSQLSWADISSAVSKSANLYIHEPYATGPDKISTIASYRTKDMKKPKHMKIDIFITTPSEYMFMLLYATGSGQFNIRMRAIAKKRGYTLNQRGLWRKSGARVPIRDEQHLFNVLGMTWKEPADRI